MALTLAGTATAINAGFAFVGLRSNLRCDRHVQAEAGLVLQPQRIKHVANEPRSPKYQASHAQSSL
jgi:hypothetical protein